MHEGHCLVIGGRGFVGSAISEVAAELGWQVTVANRKDYDQHVGQRFDLVINANGNSKRFLARREPLMDFKASAASVYASLFDFQFDHYVLVSTVDVYNDPTSASATGESVPIALDSLAPYSFHKRLAELFVMRNCESWQIVRLAQMVGPHLTKGPVFDLLNKQPLWIDPRTRLHYLHTRHVAESLFALADKGSKNEIYNVCGRGSVEFSRVLELLPPDWPVDRQAATEQQIYEIDSSKTSQIVPLPDSWHELKEFMEDALASGGGN